MLLLCYYCVIIMPLLYDHVMNSLVFVCDYCVIIMLVLCDCLFSVRVLCGYCVRIV